MFMNMKKLSIISTVIVSLFVYGLVSNNSDLVIVIFFLPAIWMFHYRNIRAGLFWLIFIGVGSLAGLNIENAFLQTIVTSIYAPALIFALRRTFFVRGKNVK